MDIQRSREPLFPSFTGISYYPNETHVADYRACSDVCIPSGRHRCLSVRSWSRGRNSNPRPVDCSIYITLLVLNVLSLISHHRLAPYSATIVRRKQRSGFAFQLTFIRVTDLSSAIQ